MIISNIIDLCTYLGTTPKDIERDVYKYTDCGAWIKWDETTVTVETIVEGSDAEFQRELVFPFDSEEYNVAIAEIEQLAEDAFNEVIGE